MSVLLSANDILIAFLPHKTVCLNLIAASHRT